MPELIKTIKHIQLQTASLATDLFLGSYRSAFHGKGMEFDEVREFQMGDDIRAIDWNVTARMNHPYVKNFTEEREMPLMLVVDLSASTRFGSRNRSKQELIAEVGGVLAFSAIKNNDKVGLLLFSDIVEKYIPPRKGLRHVFRIIRELIAFEPKQYKTDIANALKFLGRLQMKSGFCFVISDFLTENYAHEMTLIAKRHDLICIRVSDPLERIFPKAGLLTLQDLENGQLIVVDSSNAKIQNHFNEMIAKKRQRHGKILKTLGAGLIDLETDKPYVPAIQKFFRIRRKRRR